MTGQPLMLRTSNNIQTLYVYNGTGSPVALLADGAYQAYAYAFDPYGVPTVTSNNGGNGYQQNPFLFAGGIQDRATGWIHYGARWYNPTTGRWTQQDTLDSPLDPLNANRYAYAGNDPINNLDPRGASVFTCVVGLIEVALAAYGIVSAGRNTVAAVAVASAIAGASVSAVPFAIAAAGGVAVALLAALGVYGLVNAIKGCN